MALQAPLAAPLFDTIDATAIAFYTNASTIIANLVMPSFRLFLILYILLWGLAHWRGLITEPIGDFATRVIKICLIAALLLNAATYTQMVSDWVYKTPQRVLDVLAPAVVGRLAGAPTPANALDLVMANVSEASQRFEMANVALSGFAIGQSFYYAICGILLEFFGYVTLALSIAVLIVSKIVLGILLAVGPLFIAFLLFDATRGMFQAWVGQVAAAMFTYFMAGVALFLGAAAMQKNLVAALAATGPGASPALGDFAGYFFVSIAVLLVLMQVPAVGSALGSGVQVTTMGVLGAGARRAERWAGDYLRRRDRQVGQAVGPAMPLRSNTIKKVS